MKITLLCPSCDVLISFSERFAGRKGMCPTCEEPVSIPRHGAGAKPGATPVGKRQPSAALIRPSSPAVQRYLRAATEAGVCSHSQVARLKEIIDRLGRGPATPRAVGLWLVKHGHLPKSGHERALKHLAATDISIRGTARECANCFEAIPPRAAACPWCGAPSLRGGRLDECVHCGTLQEPDRRTCRSCHAAIRE